MKPAPPVTKIFISGGKGPSWGGKSGGARGNVRGEK
jgi:hypothetical protein